MNVTPEQLEQEADELLKRATQAPEPEPDPEPDDTAAEPSGEDDGEALEAAVQDDPPAAPDTDPDLADKLRVAEERVRNAQARMTQATQEAAANRRRIEELERALEEAKKAPPQPPADTDADASLESLMQEYPEIVTPLVERLRHLEGRLGTLSNQVETTHKTVQETTAQESARAHREAVMRAHPDAYAIAATPEFQAWVGTQPPVVQAAVQNGSTEDAIWVLDQYKSAAKPAATNDRMERARASASPAMPSARRQPVTPQPRFTRDQIARMSPEEFTRHEKAIDEAMAKGLIL